MKKLTKLATLVCALSFLGGAVAFANPIDSDSAIGVFAMGSSEIGVYGLQYQHWFNDKIGMQLEGYAYYNPNVSYDDVLQYNICGEFQYKLYETCLGERSATNLYAWGLIGHHAYIKNTTNYDSATNTSTMTSSGFCPSIVGGFGFGFDVMFLNHISIPVEFGFLGEFPYNQSVGFVFGSGIRYRF